MPRDEDALPLPPMGGFHIEAARRAQRLPLGSWRTLVGVPALCEALGVAAPRWALDLLDHAGDLAAELPGPVLESLTSPDAVLGIVRYQSAAVRRWGEHTGLWGPGVGSGEYVVLTPLGHLVRDMRGETNREQRVGRRQLLEPFRPLEPGETPEVVEDGTKGEVVFKLEDAVLYCGPAWLGRGRGTRLERLFQGRWVHHDTAEAYAREHGHDFRGDG
jgi:hypothetical protein